MQRLRYGFRPSWAFVEFMPFGYGRALSFAFYWRGWHVPPMWYVILAGKLRCGWQPIGGFQTGFSKPTHG